MLMIAKFALGWGDTIHLVRSMWKSKDPETIEMGTTSDDDDDDDDSLMSNREGEDSCKYDSSKWIFVIRDFKNKKRFETFELNCNKKFRINSKASRMHEATGFPIYLAHRFCLRCIIKSRIGKATCSPASGREIGFQIMRIPITVIGIYIYIV